MQTASVESPVRARRSGLVLRPVELTFALLGGAATLVLLSSLGWHSPMSVEAGIGTGIYLLLLLSALRWPVMADPRAHLGVNYLFVIWFYNASSRISAALGSRSWDAALLVADRRLFGETPSVAMEAWTHPWITDVMSGCYAFYHFYMHGMLVLMTFTREEGAARRFGDGLYAGFAVGFAGYLLVPALGPGGEYPTLYHTPLAGGIVTCFNAWLVARGAAIYGDFPSLHLLVTAILLDHDWNRCRRRFWIVLTPALGLFASTLYLRYHYAVDLLAGLATYLALRATILRWNPHPP